MISILRDARGPSKSGAILIFPAWNRTSKKPGWNSASRKWISGWRVSAQDRTLKRKFKEKSGHTIWQKLTTKFFLIRKRQSCPAKKQKQSSRQRPTCHSLNG